MIYHIDSEKGPRFRNRIEQDLERLRLHVEQLKNSASGLERKRYKTLFAERANFAIAYLHLPSGIKKYLAFSGVQEIAEDLPSWQDNHGFQLVEIVELGSMRYPAQSVALDNVILDIDQPYLRNVDSESKIIEKVDRDLDIMRLEGQHRVGTLLLYSLKEPCASCEQSLFDFMINNHKLLDVTVLFSNYLKNGVKKHGKPVF
ncbi:deaminase domain-containing protein [Tumebacillus flagellatus]|uniref:Uncharacterized protein n=1 Tax=Tumebacillus flagellatus TaxID=1157490 RepID=A0A074LRW7_9BACL|nr:deaminase domain-containing protein [Tumebacillus flagellatus]KEO84891.1 hypothetical protein EL26_02450 [Tumebacillus flagellatus]